MATHDYYETLGVSKTASGDEIRKSYKKLAREYHPDVKPDDKAAAEKFKEIQEAYGVLSDEKKRQQYDQFGRVFGDGAGGGPGGGFEWTVPPGAGGGGAAFDIEDLLGGMFGGGGGGGGGGRRRSGGGGSPFGGFGRGGRSARASKGQDVKSEIQVPFHVAASGGEHELTISRGDQRERLSIRIPPGVDNGRVMRLAGQGHPDPHGGKPGDLLVTIQVAPHPWFRREGTNLILELPLTPAEAVLGTRVDVPTLEDGTLVLTIPPGTSSGSRLRLREKGIPDPETGRRGDQLVSVKIVAPTDLSDEAAGLYQRLADLPGQSPREGLWR